MKRTPKLGWRVLPNAQRTAPCGNGVNRDAGWGSRRQILRTRVRHEVLCMCNLLLCLISRIVKLPNVGRYLCQA